MVGSFAKNAAGIAIPTIWTHKWCEIQNKPPPMRTAWPSRHGWWFRISQLEFQQMSLVFCQRSENSPMPSMEFSLGRKDEGHCALAVCRRGGTWTAGAPSDRSLPNDLRTLTYQWSNSNLFPSGCGCVLKLKKLGFQRDNSGAVVLLLHDDWSPWLFGFSEWLLPGLLKLGKPLKQKCLLLLGCHRGYNSTIVLCPFLYLHVTYVYMYVYTQK